MIIDVLVVHLSVIVYERWDQVLTKYILNTQIVC